MNVNYCSLSATNITASSQDPSFPVSNLKHPFRSKRWRSIGSSSQTVVFDFITTEAMDSVVILWPKEDGIRLSETATIRIQANATNSWSSPAIDQALTINNTYMVASHYFETDQNYRYWRVVVDDPGNPYGYIELGVVWIGKSLNIENAQNGFKYGLVDKTSVTTTDYGHRFCDEYPIMSSLSFDYQYMDYLNVCILENAFRANGVRLPVVVVLDEKEILFDKDHFFIYGHFSSSISDSHVVHELLHVEDIVIVEAS